MSELQEANNNLPAELMDEFEAHANKGMENVDSESIAIPMLKIVERMSTLPEEIEGAKPGSIYNTASQEVAEELTVVPIQHARVFTEWEEDMPKQEWSVRDGKEAERRLGRDGGVIHLENGNRLMDTHKFVVLVVNDDGSTEPAWISMMSSRIESARNWIYKSNKLILPSGNVAPLYAGQYRLSTRKAEKKGNSWFVWTTKSEGLVKDASVFNDAKRLRESVENN